MAGAYFFRNFDWPIPGTRSLIACKGGHSYPALKRELVDDAVKAGAAEELPQQTRAARKPRAPKR